MNDTSIALHWAKVKDGVFVRAELDLPRFDEDFEQEQVQAILSGTDDAEAITESTAEAHGWLPIANADVPSVDPLTQKINPLPTVTLVEGIPTADWGLRSLSSEEEASATAAYNEAQRENRRRAFAMEWDSLAGKQKRGEAIDDGSGSEIAITDQMLADTATEIRARYPYR